MSESVMTMRIAMSAIAHASPHTSFGDIIQSELPAFRGKHVIYATHSTESHIQQLRIDRISEACPAVRSLFDGSGLLFYSDRVYADTLAGRAEIKLDYSIMLDKNVCEDVRRYVTGKSLSRHEAFRQLLTLVRGRGQSSFNYDYLAYLAEDFEHLHENGNERPLHTLRGLKRLDYLVEADLDAFPALTTSAQLAEKLDREVRELLSFLMREGALEQIHQYQSGGYAILLQAVLLRWEGVTQERALEKLIEFSLYALGKLAKMELYFAWKIFESGAALPNFFQPAIRPSSKALHAIRGMSWDLSLFRTAELMSAMRRDVDGCKPDFFIPLLASYDKKFADMVQACPLRAIVIDRQAKLVNSIFRDELAFQTAMKSAMENSRIDLGGSAAQARRYRQDVDEPHLRSVIAGLERRIAAASSAAS